MNSKKFFTIVTIAYNDFDNLCRTYKSLKKQVYKNFEWIVVDGGSNDSTTKWLSSLNPEGFAFSWVSEFDEGISDAWNKGINMSSSSMILLLNAGDIYYDDFLLKIKPYVSENKITCASANVVTPDFKVWSVFSPHPKKLKKGMYVPHNWCVIPKRIYDKVGEYKKIPYSMDFEWFSRFIRIYSINDIVCVDGLIGGEYLLEGVSDKNYILSFKANRVIMIESGRSIFYAWTNYFISILKHSISRILRRKFK